MQHEKQSLYFKIRKFLRYLRLYGFGRTLSKVRARQHMKKRYEILPEIASPQKQGGHIGLIGCGNFAFSNTAFFLCKNYGHVIRGAMDIDINKAASLYEKYNLRYYTDNAEKIINDPEIDLVYIASNHASHAEYAIKVLRAGKNVHIEKPHVVNHDQLHRLCVAMKETRGKVRLGFNRPQSRIGRMIKKYIDSQTGPAMFNWFIVGHQIESGHWYFKKDEGSRILGNLCHWTDFIYQIVAPENRYPLTINPTRGKKTDCDIAVTYTFGDESIAVITFSAKGHTFEGVRERLSAHRGDVLISMNDFKDMTVEIVEKKLKLVSLFRDQGHEQNIKKSYEMTQAGTLDSEPGCSIDYVWETGNLFLETRKALEENRQVVVYPLDKSRFETEEPLIENHADVHEKLLRAIE